MKTKIAFLILISSILLITACTADVPNNGGTDSDIAPDTPVEATAIPEGQEPAPIPVDEESNAGPVSQVFIDEMNLLIMESYPIQLSLYVNGNLPTPCHEIKMTVNAPNSQNEIHVDLFSQVPDAEMMCVQVLEPIDTNLSIDVSRLPDGEYTLIINGEVVGVFTYPG